MKWWIWLLIGLGILIVVIIIIIVTNDDEDNNNFNNNYRSDFKESKTSSSPITGR